MVKATLRTNTTKKEAPVIDVVATAPALETGTGSQDLTHLLPSQGPEPTPPVDNAHVAPGCEQFGVPATIPQTSKTVAKYEAAKTEGFEGDWGADDVKFPQLKLVQGSGPLSQQFDAGTIIFGDLELFRPASVKDGAVNPFLKFAPISITKQWREKLSQDSVAEGLMPRIAQNLAEVEELDGTTRWSGDTMPDNLWEPSARCILLIEQPEGNEHPGFALELDGKVYAVAVYYAAGGAFRDSAKVIFNTAMTSLLVPLLDSENKPIVKNGRPQKRPLLYKNYWRLSFAKKQAGNFTPWRPIVKLQKEETGPEARAFCESIAHSSADAAPAE